MEIIARTVERPRKEEELENGRGSNDVQSLTRDRVPSMSSYYQNIRCAVLVAVQYCTLSRTRKYQRKDFPVSSDFLAGFRGLL
jgi:hypothetical protein